MFCIVVYFYNSVYTKSFLCILGGELLGTYEDNARDFLFPTPKVSPTYPGVDREVLLQRSASFPGRL